MNPEETPLKQIRTFQGDVAEALRKQQESLVSIQQREHLKQGPVPSLTNSSTEIVKQKKRVFLLFLGSVMLLVIGVVGIWYAYKEFVKKTSIPIAETLANQFLSPNSERVIELNTTSRETFISNLTEVLAEVPQGELRHVVLEQKVTGTDNALLSTNNFLNRLESRAPGSLVRAFDPLFMLGAFGQSTFLIIKLSSFENAFAGMLLWEKSLSQDLGPLFATAPLLRNLLPESTFSDITDRNKDIRMLSYEGKGVLFYTFFDNKILIITDGLETLRTLIDRLTREKLSR